MEKGKLAEVLNFFDPVELNQFNSVSYIDNDYSLGRNISINSHTNTIADNTRFDIVFFAVNRNLNNEPHNNFELNSIREELYQLSKFSSGIRIADLGNLRTGQNMNETLFALQEACNLLLHQQATIIVIGGDQLLTLGTFASLKEYENNINLAHIDSRIDLAVSSKSASENDYLNHLIENEAANLYNISCMAYQSYFTSGKQLKILGENYFDHYRLGVLRNDLSLAEPVFRDADIASFDISALRMTDAPAQSDGSPNGLYADEACQLTRYAGLSNRLRIFGLYNIEPNRDLNKQTAKLAAQMLWYFIDGFMHRKNDEPNKTSDNCTKYEVQIDEIDFPIVFYKNEQTDRWWIEVSAINTDKTGEERQLVASNEADYRMACQGEIPDRWWINFKKMK
ncbi:MAG TPA: arginase family protein [Prolixibacteraceae bacterium]|nr:arginase family protein [Prolixibacteraceae bacterium]